MGFTGDLDQASVWDPSGGLPTLMLLPSGHASTQSRAHICLSPGARSAAERPYQPHGRVDRAPSQGVLRLKVHLQARGKPRLLQVLLQSGHGGAEVRLFTLDSRRPSPVPRAAPDAQPRMCAWRILSNQPSRAGPRGRTEPCGISALELLLTTRPSPALLTRIQLATGVGLGVRAW